MSYIEKHEVLCPADMGLGECRCMFKEYNERGTAPPPDPALAIIEKLVARKRQLSFLLLLDGDSPSPSDIHDATVDLDAAWAEAHAHLAARAHLTERGE